MGFLLATALAGCGEGVSRQLFVCGAGSFVALTLYTPASVPVDESLAAAREVAGLVMSRL